MAKYETLLTCVQETDVAKFVKELHHFLSLSYFVVGSIATHTRIAKFFPLTLVTEYTAFVTKVIPFEEDEKPLDEEEILY